MTLGGNHLISLVLIFPPIMTESGYLTCKTLFNLNATYYYVWYHHGTNIMGTLLTRYGTQKCIELLD